MGRATEFLGLLKLTKYPTRRDFAFFFPSLTNDKTTFDIWKRHQRSRKKALNSPLPTVGEG